MNPEQPITEPAAPTRATCCSCSPSSQRSGLLAIVPGFLLAIAPKCPFCWAAYMSAFGSLGISVQIPYQPWLLPLVTGLLAVNLIALFLRARNRSHFGPFYLCLSGGLIIVGGKFWLGSGASIAVGLACVIAGSLWNAALRPKAN